MRLNPHMFFQIILDYKQQQQGHSSSSAAEPAVPAAGIAGGNGSIATGGSVAADGAVGVAANEAVCGSPAAGTQQAPLPLCDKDQAPVLLADKAVSGAASVIPQPGGASDLVEERCVPQLPCAVANSGQLIKACVVKTCKND